MHALTWVVFSMIAADLPVGSAPEPVPVDHFPSRLHAFVWRNWQLVPVERMAEVVGAEPAQLVGLAWRMGLPPQPTITEQQRKRSYITVIRRNWHLLPYSQLLVLLGWTEDQLAYVLKEDDFLWAKLGSLKPKCDPITYHEPDATERAREDAIRHVVERDFPGGALPEGEPLFGFIDDLCSAGPGATAPRTGVSRFSPRYCYSYFAPYGDPLLDPSIDPYPDPFLARLAGVGVTGVWLQVVLYRVAPFPWDASLSEGWETRLRNLGALVERAKRHGIRVYLYMNEPRAMPARFFEAHPDVRGVTEGGLTTLCTSTPEVRAYLTDSLARVFGAVPDLGGVFTITASENLTSCWSHYQGAQCPRCAKRSLAEVIAEVNTAVEAGVHRGSPSAEVIAWDWGWPDDAAEAIIDKLPTSVALQSVSEWSLPITRGGVASEVGEYSISSVGPGPRAPRHWGFARSRGHRTLAKMQLGTTWELGSMPYIPATCLVAEHLCNLASRQDGVDGLMLGWTLGGYPSPNLELAGIVDGMENPTPDAALELLATRRFGAESAPSVLRAWRVMSDAFREFPFHIGLVYSGPQHMGPANLLYERPSGYRATMTGFPYDDLDTWRAIYPPEVFIAQFDKTAAGFVEGARMLRAADEAGTAQGAALAGEASIAEATAIDFRSCATQARYVLARNHMLSAPEGSAERTSAAAEVAQAVREELHAAVRLHALQCADSRIGFEATNHYFYVPLDLVEKVVNCEHLLERGPH